MRVKLAIFVTPLLLSIDSNRTRSPVILKLLIFCILLKRLTRSKRVYQQLRDKKLCGTNFGRIELDDPSFASLTKLDADGNVVNDFRSLSAWKWTFNQTEPSKALR